MSVKIKNIYKSSVKCDYQQQYKAILESAMVSTPEGFTENLSISPVPYVTIKNPSARISLRQFTGLLDVKDKIAVLGLGDVKSNQKPIISGSMLWYSIPKG